MIYLKYSTINTCSFSCTIDLVRLLLAVSQVSSLEFSSTTTYVDA